MARKATGQVVELKRKRGMVYALRFRAGGQRRYVTLGTPDEGWTRATADEELVNVLADVRRGIWRPPDLAPQPEVGRPEPTFHKFASEWLERRRPELAPKTVATYRWALVDHLLPVFHSRRLSQITAEAVDDYKAAKLRDGRLGPNQVNTTLVRLSQILGDAVEYGHIPVNPAAGRRRRVKGSKPRRSWVEPEQLPSLLEAASDHRQRAIVAVLAGCGLRAGEACGLNWRDVNLATGTLTVRESKTDAGSGRQVDMPLGVRDVLIELKARTRATGRDDPILVTRAREGAVRRQSVSNVGRRLKTVIKRSNRKLEALEIEPISDRVTPHSLRRTYASLRFALGDDPVYVAEQLGHTAAEFSMSVYAKAVKRRQKLSGSYLEQFEQALDWALLGTSGEDRQIGLSERERPLLNPGLTKPQLATSPDSSAG